MRRLKFLIVCWTIFLALYLFFTGLSSPTEFVVGAIAALVVSAALSEISARSPHHFQLNLHSLGKLRALPAQMLSDCLVVYRGILRRPTMARGSGRFQTREFHGGNEHPAARGRRALVTLGISCAPNTYVLGRTNSPNEQLLVHQLLPKEPAGDDRDWPL